MSSTRANRSTSAGATLVLLACLATRSVAAQPAANDAAMAETLFEDAKKMMARGDYAAACPKLSESNRLDPGSGTLTALALCHEQEGKTATAWAEFIQVVSEAQQAGRTDREKFARQHLAALEPVLSRLTITVAPETAQLSDLVVRRDQIAVGAAAWGVASPVDPGDHVVEALAPGKKSWSAHVSLNASGDAGDRDPVARCGRRLRGLGPCCGGHGDHRRPAAGPGLPTNHPDSGRRRWRGRGGAGLLFRLRPVEERRRQKTLLALGGINFDAVLLEREQRRTSLRARGLGRPGRVASVRFLCAQTAHRALRCYPGVRQQRQTQLSGRGGGVEVASDRAFAPVSS
jgi:hypothetical protein